MWSDLLLAAAAFAAGNLVGWFARALWQTRALTKEINAKMDDLNRDERGAFTLTLERARDLVIVLMLLVVLWSAWQSERTSARVEREADERAATLDCLSTWSTEFAAALDVRTSRNTAITKARDDHDAAVADVFAAVLPLFRPDAGPGDSQRLRDALERHRKTYATLSELVEKSAETQAANPYPDPPRACYG
jgi:hypothetical protein